ncbi:MULTISPECIES: hypothetical protein [unclassified Streptomyces]|uniref:hypothetical protein n=1 Tax=unclassified Streptomyces TaxID=2593676 RepID=UPI00224CE70F|nr:MULTISPECIES: hypothetical protein [unclassified Streptomyces]MCX5138469.1 hypothetical protein [Streptomyces sp. NBC_00338]WRZ63148.1 hypothetical protein OG408_04320 [Streptomyces sp. NBC_01257]WSU57123.1 hypothetical protein OG450_04325 [Streptomyces sp. NBC_01104]
MAVYEPEFSEAGFDESGFSETGVRIDRWARSVTRAGQVTVKDGRVALLTSYGREIDSAPAGTVSAGRPWFAGADRTVARVNGRRYRLTMPRRRDKPDSAAPARRFLEAVLRAGGRRG